MSIVFYTKEKDEKKALNNLERAMQTIEKRYTHLYDRFFRPYKGIGYIRDSIERPDSYESLEELKRWQEGDALVCADTFSDENNFIGCI